MIPLVRISVDTRAFVAAREHGYEDESFVILELAATRLAQVLAVAGGGC